MTVPVAVSTERVGFDLDGPRHLVGLSGRLIALSRAAAGVVVAIGLFALLGYVTRWKGAVQLAPSLPPMYPNAALGFVVGGLSSLAAAQPGRMPRRAAIAGFAAITGYGVVTLGLHVVEAGPTWLEALWPDDPFVAATTPVAGRPVAETCVAFVCIGVAGMLLAGRRAPRWTQGLALGTVSVGSAAILGYVIGVNRRALGSSFVVVGMALHTAIAVALLGFAVLVAQPTIGLFGRLTHSGPSAQLGRRLVAVVVVAPIALTAVSAGLARWLPDARLAQSITAIGQVLALGLLVMLPLGAADRVEVEATEALREARRLTEGTAERDLITTSITRRLLGVPVAPKGWEVGYRQEVAYAALPGDTCQLLTRDDGRCLLVVVDVAGHGTEPALQALRLRTETAALWRAGSTVEQLAGAINSSMVEVLTIATGVLVDLDIATGDCRYVNAGHPPVVVARAGSIEDWQPTGPLFGLPAATFPVTEAHLDRSCFLVVYTDGVTEARSLDRSFLGESAIHRSLRHHLATGAQAIADGCVDAALAHSSSRLRDDALVVVLTRH